ncbi:ACT11D09.4 [Cucumis melo var. makuwa]|uniref:ACT11D09.4 n=2 Tax=Cucumis melo TaxID=3656 RepID=A0A5A7TJN2_CUCMM|nr:ACT11D09.4 [Cucumis melo]KAA0043018.1 ACT11D09.4 [Cucumis melo var. makuwa]TYK06501.1 ACT11D09.4 [Cucumis melo var. makuwa]
MSPYRFLLRSLRRSSTSPSYAPALTTIAPLNHHIPPSSQTSSPISLLLARSFSFSSAEEAAAERRRRKRRLRIEPPLHALRRDNYPPPQRDPNAPRLPDSTSALVGPRLNLHNRVQSLIRAGDLDAASSVARHSVFSNTRPTVFTCNAIIAAMYRAKRYSDAIALFQFFFNQSNIVPNVVSYNNLINAHCDEGRVDVGLEVYRHIIANAPFSPSAVTYRHLTKGLIDAGRIEEAVDLLREMLNKGHGADSLVFNNLISGFLNLGNLVKANELFDELKERCLVYDGVVNATFMDWFFNQGKEKEAMESYKSLLDRQFKMVPATCNVLLEVLLKHEKKTEAWTLFDQMLDNHTPPNFQAVNSDTFNIMVNECFKLGKFTEAVETFRKVGTQPKSRPFAMDVAGYNNIIARFCEQGMMADAETFFAELCSKSLSPDVPTHRTLIESYLKIEQIDDALRVFNRMVDVGLRVVASFGNMVFGELIKNGKAADCAQILTKMGERDPKPDPTCYDVVIRGLCNEGALDTSRELLDQIMRYGIGLTPTLEEFVKDAFVKAGRHEEIERLLNMNKWGHAAYRPPSGPPRISQSQVPPQMGRPLQGPPQMAEPNWRPSINPQARGSYSSPQMSSPSHFQSGPPQMTGSNYFQSGSAQMTKPQHSSFDPPPMEEHHSQQPPQMAEPNWQPSINPQARGSYSSPQMSSHSHFQSGPPQTTGSNYFQSGSAQMTKPQHSSFDPPRMEEHHSQQPPQMAEPNWRPSINPQARGSYSSPQMSSRSHFQSGPPQTTFSNYFQSGSAQMTKPQQSSFDPHPMEEHSQQPPQMAEPNWRPYINPQARGSYGPSSPQMSGPSYFQSRSSQMTGHNYFQSESTQMTRPQQPSSDAVPIEEQYHSEQPPQMAGQSAV